MHDPILEEMYRIKDEIGRKALADPEAFYREAREIEARFPDGVVDMDALLREVAEKRAAERAAPEATGHAG